MKTIGELLSRARLERGLTLEKLSSLTRIDVRFIDSLERNDFASLPPATFTKGFIRNLAKVLDKDPDEMVAIFRRDYHLASQPASLPTVRREKFKLSYFLNSQYLLLGLGALIFLVYLAFQYRAVITPPALTIDSPVDGTVTTSPISLKGHSESGATITINDSLKISLDQQGEFDTKLNLPTGEGTIKITSTSRFGRSISKTLNLTIISQ